MTFIDPSEAARFFQTYAKRFAAGAFATPTAKEIANDPLAFHQWDEGGRTIAYLRQLTRPSSRRDWTGEEFLLGAGSVVATHVAREPGALVPDALADHFFGIDYVMAYVEDHELTAAMRAAGREPVGVRITAASEIIWCWGVAGEGRRYPPVDELTLRELPLDVDDDVLADAVGEVLALSGWDDDYPFYSDGSWGQLSLRGYDLDPRWGLKPAEMPAKWKAEHPDDLARVCDWTTLTAVCPAVYDLTQRIADGHALERVRLMRISRPGKAARLGRHTDITDRNAGIRDGAISRLHFPLVSHADIQFHCWTLDGEHVSAHLEPGHLYYFDQRKPHAVTNPTGAERIHLVVDVVSDERFRARLLA